MKQQLLWLMLLSLLLTACRQQAAPAGPVPAEATAMVTTMPAPTRLPAATPLPATLEATVDSAYPLDSFPTRAAFTVHFNQPVVPGNTRTPLGFSPAVRGRYQWNDDHTSLTFIPEENFQPGRSYQATLHSSLRSAAGLTFDGPQRWRFQVQTVPEVAQRTPADTETADRQPTIRLRFNRPMDRDSVATALHVEPAVPYQLAWTGTTLLIQIQQRLDYHSVYQFRLDQTAADRDGVAMLDDYAWSYRLKGALARLSSPTVSDRQASLKLHFNYPLDAESLSKALHIEPAITGELTWNYNKTIATFTAAAPLPVNTAYTIRFDAPLRDQYGDELPLPDPLQFVTPPPILGHRPTGQNVNPVQPVSIVFDRLMDEAETAAAFTITPALPGTFSWNETTLTFQPDEGYLAENTSYTITVSAGATSADGEPILIEPYTWSFHTGRFQDVASFGWGPNAQVLDADGRRAVQFQVNQQEPATVTFELYRLNLAQFLDRYSSGFRGVAGWEDSQPISTEGTTLVRSWPVATTRSPVEWHNVQEVLLPADVPPGLYILNLKAGRVNDQLILLLTRHTLMVKQAEGQLVTWVTDINGAPVADIEVSVYARDGQRISGGRTDAGGIFSATVARDPQPLIVIARDGDDVTASGLSNEWRSGGWWDWWQVPETTDRYAAYVYTDRPIYKPGQTVYYKAIVRQDDDAIISLPPEGTTVTVRIRDARNNVVQTVVLATNSFGTVNGRFQLAEGAMLGSYAVEVALGNESHRQTFKVEEYRKPDYQVTVMTTDMARAPADRFIEGDTIQVTVDTAYFFGEPVANADIVINRFVLGWREWWDDSSSDEYIWYQSYDAPQSGRTDADGRYTFTLPADASYYAQDVDWQSSLKRSAWAIEATVDDGSHQTSSGFAVVHVFSASEKLSLDVGGYFQGPGQPFAVRAQAQTVFGQPVADQALQLTLRRWSSASYSYETVVQSAAMTTGADGRAQLDFTIEQPGFYQLRLSGHDSQGRSVTYETYVYAFSRDAGAWYGRSDDLNVNADKASYAPGDRASLLIESTFSGPALLTFQRGTTRREQLVQLTAPVTLVEVMVQPDDAPNIYVTVNAWQEQDTTLGEDVWQSLPDSHLRTASVNLSVPVTDKTLSVTITPDQEVYGPRQEATFTVHVTNQAGVPVSAEVSLAMVDEAIFALSDDLSGDIFDAFYRERANLVRTYNALALIRYLGGGGGGGGGGDMAGSPRSDFPDTAAWFPVLHTDHNGEATISLTLPDSLTSWRLTARATTADTQVGQGRTNVTVKQDIIVRPILPRSLTAGDHFILSALVHNYSDTAQTLNVQLAMNNEQLTIDNSQLTIDNSQLISLPANGLRVVTWPLTAVAAGEADVLISVTADGVTRDAVQLPLAIRPLAVPDVTTQVGQFSGAFNTTLTLPEGALPQSSVRIELSRSIAGTLLEGLEYLTGFPYGCVEQTMSRALPNAVVGRAFHQLGAGNPTLEADLPAKINASVQRLYGFQHNDGGWGWWFDDRSDAYQTAWVIFGLAVMADAGYEIDSGVIERGAAWLNDNLSGMDNRTRAYALYSMAAAGQPNLEATRSLAGQLDGLDTFSQAGLALALHQAGDRTRARAIVDYLAETAVTGSDGRVHWPAASGDAVYDYRTMASDTRSTALALSAFSQIRPGHALEGGMVRWLMGQRRQHGWGTTNETAYAILGLTDHLLATSFSEAATATGYTVELNGQTIASGSLGRGEPATSLEIPAEQLAGGANSLRLSHSGSGRLYYTINNRIYLAQEQIEAAGAVRVDRAYLDPATNKPIETVTAGQLVKVRLTVTLPDNAAYVLVEDRLPGGLEALNESLNTTSHAGSAYEDPPSYWREYGYNYKEIRDDRVTFFITEMETGTRTFTYYARATHAGAFVAMPVEVYAMYDLATWGRSASSTLLVSD